MEEVELKANKTTQTRRSPRSSHKRMKEIPDIVEESSGDEGAESDVSSYVEIDGFVIRESVCNSNEEQASKKQLICLPKDGPTLTALYESIK